MGIDGIGKPPGAAIGGPAGLQGSEATHASEPFVVEPGASTAAGSRISAALSSLQRGELSLDQYLDGRVSEATQHLNGTISPEQLEFVKQSLREQMATDPVLVELVQRTTGFRPAAELG
jgi:hypothetical protein